MLFSPKSLLGPQKSHGSTSSSSLSNCSASLSNILPPYSALVHMNVGSDNHAALGDGWHILHRNGYECMNVGSDNHAAVGDGWHILHRNGYECRSRQRGESFERCCSHCLSGFCVLPKHIYICFQTGTSPQVNLLFLCHDQVQINPVLCTDKSR